MLNNKLKIILKLSIWNVGNFKTTFGLQTIFLISSKLLLSLLVNSGIYYIHIRKAHSYLEIVYLTSPDSTLLFLQCSKYQ